MVLGRTRTALGYNDGREIDWGSIVVISFIVLLIAVAVLIVKKTGFDSSKILLSVWVGTLGVIIIIGVLSIILDIGVELFFVIIPVGAIIIYIYFIAWIISLIRNHILRDRINKYEQNELMKEQNDLIKELNNKDKDVSESLEPLEILERLARLKEAGAISSEEYEEKKKELLSKI